MTTLPPPATKNFPEDSLEKKVYNIVDSFSEFLPIPNDRSRLGFSLFKYLKGEGDNPSITLKTAKVRIVGIQRDELAQRISKELDLIRK